jgi:hypothetical protein
MDITPQQEKAIKNVVQYSIENERKDLEETLYTMFDGIEFYNMSDKELNIFCEKKGVDHIWTSFYEISFMKYL